MVLCARCRTCGRTMQHKVQCPALLGNHCVCQHPCTNISHFTCKLHTGQDNTKKDCKKNGNFKTTVECWSPGCSCLHCPTCNKEIIPIIRRRRNKITRTISGALLVLGCWPLCFLPFVMKGFDSSMINLYCPKCMTYLGFYKRRAGIVILQSEKNRPCCVSTICAE